MSVTRTPDTRIEEQSYGFDPGRAAPLLLQHGHSGRLGLKYRAHGDNWAELELPWREDLLGEAERHVLASGPIISMMDTASSLSIWTAQGRFTAIATLDLRVDYQRPARDRAAVIGRAECYKITRSAAFVRGIAHDGDPEDPVAHVAGVFMHIAGDPGNG
ncbi:PaaI family thioesterase [Allopontixanthobacter sediminis]|uniref:Phenylacetic acid degradation protein n=1 Tax=Allopontixanthobacter sediminis TaxID=1689985 RepID=A0A845B4U6_9SPHN|nr:PaaI family thioesterase [Allopontixanthobacter sediminis]MXP45438.1 phenylacetic acid degradation protein [Allopontixanthobacter sediminis]